ncbi:aspartyl-phosphate phosphatase Spo0E family protein [Priestia flexa]|uniref:Aspartyl-phosphate phosphatase Spo0E family protein n=1 Tax=Priestia flexa TaxID=86664 RepID=A0A1N6TAS3_9BACI|nr:MULTISPECIES: aspartyl-phosphate phosphatase Spo0E family protein [Bacillaceae]MBN8251642.1 aspartyl-phosphate phosphatase Spo0E family protein [Priestia flexa]MBN8434940.1 aspartyl-phosphate phosphatase Spo0E family protein [Priestia flexa]MBY6087494.1 aspartyl-phosphate phosphatase Spo0E family protein [Priestia flexa]MCA0967719.1 aspartyl-phosphate phosphatase Spo0E family protein [Priestia flexa]MCA1203167.1 aspartyl-phosphate phosphatase Spo0E family protein [Priestia flexa]
MLKQNILLEIEKKREELIRVVRVSGLNSPPAIKHSQELDHLLNIYNNTPSQHSDTTST